jgi:hypothetical protein
MLEFKVELSTYFLNKITLSFSLSLSLFLFVPIFSFFNILLIFYNHNELYLTQVKCYILLKINQNRAKSQHILLKIQKLKLVSPKAIN